MATAYSTQVTAIRAGRSITPLDEGVQKTIRWDYVVPVGNQALADLVILGALPKDAKLMGGRESHSALSSGAGAATGQIGLYKQSGIDGYDLGAVVDNDLLQAAVTYDAAGQNEIGITEGTGLYYQTLDPVLIVATVSVEAWIAAGTFKGHLHYLTSF